MLVSASWWRHCLVTGGFFRPKQGTSHLTSCHQTQCCLVQFAQSYQGYNRGVEHKNKKGIELQRHISFTLCGSFTTRNRLNQTSETRFCTWSRPGLTPSATNPNTRWFKTLTRLWKWKVSGNMHIYCTFLLFFHCCSHLKGNLWV